MTGGFEGFVTIGTTDFNLFLQVTNSAGTPSTPDATPAYRIYAPSGGAALLTGNYAASDTDSQTGWRVSGNLSITIGNNFATGSTYRVRSTYAVSGTSYVRTAFFSVV